MQGRGKETFPNGSRYEGNFVDGDYSGLGAFTWADGLVHEGEWADGLRSGFGMQWNKKGTLMGCGLWTDSAFHERPVPRSKIPVGGNLSAAGE